MDQTQIRDDFVLIVNSRPKKHKKSKLHNTIILATGYGSALMVLVSLLAMEHARTLAPAITAFLSLGWFFLFVWVNGDVLERRWDKR